MSYVQNKLEEFSNQNAYGALSGARETIDYINQGKNHLVYHFYKQTCRYGDWEKVRGIEEILDVMGSKDLLKEQPQVHFSTDISLGEDIHFDEYFEEDYHEFTIHLSEGRYELSVELDKEDGEFSFRVYDKTDHLIDSGYPCKHNEKGIIDINEFEDGICKFEVYGLKQFKLKNIKITRN